MSGVHKAVIGVDGVTVPMVAEPTDKSVYTFALGQRDFKYHTLISFSRF